ncbi:MAG: hypothetical protein IJH84_26755 [Saccharopolyspora sp.]|uniref:hypothetical protein n=1 Tax=Saccharopolyspora sp. TaxID=33915 RepID=UPI0025EBBBB9|nr:hypothetical protein [Saccharopolyspora sp.]MBQ6644607.1 hypothetical protein [Saccharopolyspora sp.]
MAFAIIPAHGHVNPTLPLVEELTRRGHRVSYLTGEAWQGPVEAAGADFAPIAAGYPLARGRTARAQRAGCARRWGFPRHGAGDRAAAGKAGVLVVRLCPTFAGNEHFSLLSRFFGDIDVQGPQFDDAREPRIRSVSSMRVLSARLRLRSQYRGVSTTRGRTGSASPEAPRAGCDYVPLPQQARHLDWRPVHSFS